LLGRPEEYLNVIFYTPWWLVIPFAALLLLAGVVMARLINANKFSLHGMYRERLIRAYLGASNSDRKENPFTGFDENDNIKMRDLWLQKKFNGKLMPVVNIALNLVSGEKLGWQERKAQSFTVSPLHCGSISDVSGLSFYNRRGWDCVWRPARYLTRIGDHDFRRRCQS
jgi:hypothetical protein